MRRVLPLLVVAACLSSACSKGTSAQASAAPANGQTPAPAAAPAKPVPAQLPDVLARVNGEVINKAEFEKAIKEMEARAGGPVPVDQRDQIYRGLLDRMIGYKLLVQESTTRKVVVPDADVETRIGGMRGQFPDENAFNEALKQQGMTLDQMKKEARQEMAISKMIEDEIAAKVAVKPEDVQKFYTENPQHFQQGEQVRASHILIGQRGMDEAAKAKARTKAEGVLKEVKAGKDFATLAKANSEDPGSASQGGDLGLFAQGQMVGPFNDVAFKLAPGAVSDLVETEFGFHIIKVTEKTPARTVPIDEVRPKIEEFLQDQNREQQTDAFVDALRAKGKVEVLI